jgi:mono/diheme cytochrome c family protein
VKRSSGRFQSLMTESNERSPRFFRGYSGSISRRRAFALLLFVFLGFGGFLSCQSKPSGESTVSTVPDRQALVRRGRAVYQTNCAVCHHSDPTKTGSLGPAVQGSSLELLEARILRGAYAPGYTPKRETHVMAPLPHLKSEIPAIHAYLNP